MAEVYVESPFDRIVDCHFGDDGPPVEPPPYGGSVTFSASGVNFVITGQEGPENSFSYFNVHMTGSGVGAVEGGNSVGIGIPPTPAEGGAVGGYTCHVEADIYAEITGGVPAGSTALSVFLLIRKPDGTVLAEGGPAIATAALPIMQAHFTIGSFPVDAAGMILKVAFRATGSPITLGFGRTFPGVVTVTVS